MTKRPQKIETRIGTLEFTHDFANGYPTDTAVEKLYDERDFQRACQAYLWSLPAVFYRDDEYRRIDREDNNQSTTLPSMQGGERRFLVAAGIHVRC